MTICSALEFKVTTSRRIHRILHHVWFFPFLLTITLIMLTALKISGSSIGVYQQFFNGNAHDSALIANKPQMVRSDEWRVNTQMILAQKNNDYKRINQNIGNGQDMSVINDVPYIDWSVIFKPHNWAFFLIPFENAFAFRWWFMGYLLILSCYFFVLTILPGKRLLAVILSLVIFFSAFIQWWYSTGALECWYYGLFVSIVIIQILRSQSKRNTLLLGIILSYLLVSFALILYPPFQIGVALAVTALVLGFTVFELGHLARKEVYRKIMVLGASSVVAILIVIMFIHTRSDVIHTIENTAYPGTRVVESGGFNIPHVFAGNLGFQFKSATRTTEYLPTYFSNQSETSNFILLLPFLLVPSVIIIYRDFRLRKPLDWPLIMVSVMFFAFLAWMFIPHLELIGKILLLNKVPSTRLLIGIGLLSFMQLILFIRRGPDIGGRLFRNNIVLAYAFLVFIFEILIGLHAKRAFPGFISVERVFLFAIPVPIIIYLVLRKRFVWAATGLLAFSLFTSVWINPLYRGTSILTQTPLSKAIKKLSQHDSGRWVFEDTRLENFASMNGAHSLSGVYAYPQLSIWSPTGEPKKSYNRYAHTTFGFDRDITTNIPTRIDLEAPDYFQVVTEPCGAFLNQERVHFIVVGVKLNPQERCVKLIDTVRYPEFSAFIYRLNH